VSPQPVRAAFATGKIVRTIAGIPFSRRYNTRQTTPANHNVNRTNGGANRFYFPNLTLSGRENDQILAQEGRDQLRDNVRPPYGHRGR